MGSACCKNIESYVRQHDSSSSTDLSHGRAPLIDREASRSTAASVGRDASRCLPTRADCEENGRVSRVMVPTKRRRARQYVRDIRDSFNAFSRRCVQRFRRRRRLLSLPEKRQKVALLDKPANADVLDFPTQHDGFTSRRQNTRFSSKSSSEIHSDDDCNDSINGATKAVSHYEVKYASLSLAALTSEKKENLQTLEMDIKTTGGTSKPEQNGQIESTAPPFPDDVLVELPMRKLEVAGALPTDVVARINREDQFERAACSPLEEFSIQNHLTALTSGENTTYCNTQEPQALSKTPEQ